MSTVDQPTATPTQKVATGAVAGALTIIIVFVAGLLGLTIPAEAASAITVCITFVSSYVVREKAPAYDGRHAEE